MDAAREKEKNFIFGAERQVCNVCNPPLTLPSDLSRAVLTLCVVQSHIHTYEPRYIHSYLCVSVCMYVWAYIP